MSALNELKKVIRYYEEDKVNPSTAKNQISGETLKELDAHIADLQARLTAAEQERDALKRDQAQEVDEFNAGYQAYLEGMEVEHAERLYHAALPDGVLLFDVFNAGYAWAKFSVERGWKTAALGKVAK